MARTYRWGVAHGQGRGAIPVLIGPRWGDQEEVMSIVTGGDANVVAVQ